MGPDAYRTWGTPSYKAGGGLGGAGSFSTLLGPWSVQLREWLKERVGPGVLTVDVSPRTGERRQKQR